MWWWWCHLSNFRCWMMTLDSWPRPSGWAMSEIEHPQTVSRKFHRFFCMEILSDPSWHSKALEWSSLCFLSLLLVKAMCDGCSGRATRNHPHCAIPYGVLQASLLMAHDLSLDAPGSPPGFCSTPFPFCQTHRTQRTLQSITWGDQSSIFQETF